MTITLTTGSLLILLGLYALLTQDNLLRIIIGFSLANTGVHLIIVSLGYLKNRTAPILNDAMIAAGPETQIVDPLPQALVLTAIVIGFAITAFLLAFALRIYHTYGTLSLSNLVDKS
ncbi:sodium:proton antiporter [Fidelibacter multiformis]|uniref:sodium:proton antiporter n=1 Tax=Fidelibacter multiformis TaxID=3377529 RepID=UPI0037DD14B9